MKSEFIRTLTATFEGHALGDHFADIGRMVDLGCGSRRETAGISRQQEQKTECNELLTLRGRVG